ncbi:MAG: hypothetical protein R3E66_18475 [bacterium]
MEKPKKKSKLWLVLAVLLGIVLALAGGYKWHRHQLEVAAEKESRELFEPAIAAMTTPDPAEPIDIDKTVRVIHAIDTALQSQGDLRSYLQYMAKQDYRGVDPQVLEARQRILDILMKLYAQQTQIENQEATYTVTRTLLSALSLVEADFSVTTPGAALDQEQVKGLLKEMRKQQEERRELLDGLTELENELLVVMTQYSEVYYAQIAKWDALCLLRDRAYLATEEGNWNAALEAADAAIATAPNEVEAHLIKAWALIEMANSVEGPQLSQAVALLNTYMKDHPDRTAPALVLLGMATAKAGDTKTATLHFQQASAYYPKQAAMLTDMMDPYKARSFLRKSKEGIAILDRYNATMVGAGAFSPDLHLARIYFDEGDEASGRKKILDHFSRRRNQEQWELILEDLKYCTDQLGAHFEQILEEDSHLFLQAKPALIGSSLNVSVSNQSDRALRNATLLLAIRFTDMHRDDFEVFKVGETVPVVPAKQETDFGSLDVAFDVFGQTKGVDDIVLTRSILITDDAVVWVDSDAYRLAQARPVGAAKPTAQATPNTSWFGAMKISPETLANLVESNAKVDVDLGLGKDDLSLVLPRELAWLDPVFRVGESLTTAPSKNQLEQGGIRLEFADLANFDEPQKPVRVVAHSRYGSLELLVDVPRRKVVDVRWNP